ncbi:MAG: hypothetical protein HY083_07060 [Gammaproteobacteria bacterium]|nr:hypothetical protein [Gammaproteobacteria bacterium]
MNEKNQSTNTSSFNLDEFSKKSEAFYNGIKTELEAQYKGKFAAIDFESKKFWIGDTVSDALQNAKAEFPTKLFYLIQVGSTATFTVQSITKKGAFSSKSYGPQRLY